MYLIHVLMFRFDIYVYKVLKNSKFCWLDWEGFQGCWVWFAALLQSCFGRFIDSSVQCDEVETLHATSLW